jgi:hypothetical protein
MSELPSPLNIPSSNSTVRVRAIDTTTDIVAAAAAVVEPLMPGHETMNFKTMCFLIENTEKNKKVLFDAGGRQDWWESAPATKGMLGAHVVGLMVEKGVHQILEETGVELQSIGKRLMCCDD